MASFMTPHPESPKSFSGVAFHELAEQLIIGRLSLGRGQRAGHNLVVDGLHFLLLSKQPLIQI